MSEFLANMATGPGLIHLAISFFVLSVFLLATYMSLKGHTMARYFLWAWGGLLLVATPFIASLATGVSTAIAAGLSVGFIPYLMIWFNRRSSQLEHVQQELRQVLAESNNRMDAERRRISRQLHDDINPRLVLAKLELKQVMALINNEIPDAEIASKVQQLLSNTQQTISDIYNDTREVIKSTRIEIIDSVGLVAAVESMVQNYKGALERPEIIFSHNIKKRPMLPDAIAANAYRIIQEALLNAVKHADASTITISLQLSGKRYSVVIADDGIGLSAKKGQGIGLSDMRERARTLNGGLIVEGGPGGGTKISFSFLHPDS